MPYINYYARLSEKEHTSFTTWAAWSKELQDRFLPPNRLDDLKEKCICHYLGSNEKFANYYEDKVYLQQFLFPANTEDSLLIRDILGGIPATLRAQLQTGVTPTMSLRNFRLHVLQIEPGFHPQLFPTSHRHPADRTHTQRTNHSNTSFAHSSFTRSSCFLPGNRPDKPSTPCFTCSAYHWSDQCTLKKQQQQQYNTSRPSSTTNNPATSTSSNGRSSFPSWARPPSNNNSPNYKPPAHSVNSIANKDGYRFNSLKPSINTLCHSTFLCPPAHLPTHALPQLQLHRTHLNKTPAYATVKFNSNDPSATTHRAVIDTGASLSAISHEYANQHLPHSFVERSRGDEVREKRSRKAFEEG
ncbi:hypothetical protein C366_02606 [Cryptococcus neoformans Tu401-1]|nr:hypothetical protein C366_02606 [Cryptococcus neoformans var. grubii Tu401-1]